MIGDPTQNAVVIPASPGPLEIEPARAALIVVDMQHSFISPGGYFDLRGVDLSGAAAIVDPCRRLVESSRRAGLSVIYLKMVIGRDYANIDPDSTPAFRKSRALRMLRQNPGLEDAIHVEGSWGAEIIPQLTPRDGDVVITKRRYNGFLDTELDQVLSDRGIRYLLFTGTATNICVETTLRHAFGLNYLTVLVADATNPSGGPACQKAVVENVESSFGWVARSKDIVDSLARVGVTKD